MSKRECDIIKDLLPSYVDEICSEASKEWIEEHLKECEECRKTVSMLKDTEISAKKLEQESLDAGRKVIRKNLRRSVFNLGLCLLTAFLMFLVFVLDGVQIPNMALYIVFPIGLLMTWLTFRNQTKLRTWDKWDFIMTMAVILATGYGAGMRKYAFSQAVKGEIIFGLSVNGFGPFLYSQMVLAALLCFAVYVFQIVRTVKQGRSNSLPLCLSLTGIFLMMGYCGYMGYLTDLESAEEILKEETFTVLLVGLNCTFVFAMMDKLVKK
ncbi:MAG: zf-HC2 domain-containing protein [Lachnospiraceae bacterium]|nr:zf-HC2 domain-containing protein [Lachnospiraceae bacterium]MBQ8878321.1 zf-HC2 domain-containing protein [Lachnospiraceae bacterium]